MYILQSHGWEAGIRPDLGMNTVFLRYRGEAVLRAPESEDALQAHPCVYGTPLLLPPNRTAGGTFPFGGTRYALPVNDPGGHHIHGSLFRMSFSVLGADSAEISGVFENTGSCFPFPFRMEVLARIGEEGYCQQFRITNTGTLPMPLTFGLHTTFVEKTPLRVPVGQMWERGGDLIPTGRRLTPEPRLAAFCRDFIPDGAPVSGFFTSRGTTARIGSFFYRVSENFDQWTLWNGSGKQGFISIEPQQGAVNALNSGEGLLTLLPGETECYQTCIGRISG